MPSKRRKTPHRIRAVIADNVRRLMDAHFPHEGDKPRALKGALSSVGISLSTIQRVLDGTPNGIGASIDTLGHIADYFQVQVYQLFIAGLDLSNPQAIRRHKHARRGRSERPSAQ